MAQRTLTLWIIALILSCLLTLLIVAILRPWAKRVDFVDLPGGRKLHRGAVPLIGGIAMFLGASSSTAVLSDQLHDYLYLFLASSLIVLLGVLDDLYDIKAKLKLLGQIVICLLVILPNHAFITSLGDPLGIGTISLNTATGIIFTLIAYLALINAVNLIDGADGLAGSTTLLSFLSLFLFCLLHPGTPHQLLLASCIGATIGFLWFNFPSKHYDARIVFMGDAGSMLLGLILCWFFIKFSQSPIASLKPVTCLWLVAFPIIETFSTIIRRIAQKRSPFVPDKLHLHHILLRSGYSNLALIVVIGLFSLLSGLCGIISDAVAPQWLASLGFMLLTLLYLYVIKHAWIASKWLKKQIFRRTLP